MLKVSGPRTRQKQLTYAIGLALASMVAGQQAMAQEAPAAPAAKETQSQDASGAPTAKATQTQDVSQVKVVGTRQSQATSIAQKKNAATAIDMIVAEDVGAFPDRNVGEAISRVAGIALERGDYGEGMNVSVRGTSADFTRVEVDGLGLQAGGGTDLFGGGGGRGVELREMSSDLIKAVIVSKGATPDMTEGSLSGSILIKTRTGLDFKKQFLSVRGAASQNSINGKWTPNTNVIFADKYLGGKLGVIANVSRVDLANESHGLEPVTSRNAGYARLVDFDNSPEKTFSFNPETVNQSGAATTPLARIQQANGQFWLGATPLDLVTRAAAAKSKADCHAAFPAIDPAAFATDANRLAASNQRGTELVTCLNQWNDFTPSLIRQFVRRERDKRTSGDIRLDYKVSDQLSLYTKFSRSERTVGYEQLTYQQGNIGATANVATVGGGVNAEIRQPYYVGSTIVDRNAPVYSAAPGSLYYLYSNNISLRPGPNFGYAQGVTLDVDPRSVTVDKNHYVTRLTVSDAIVNKDQIVDDVSTGSSYSQAGGEYRNGPFRAEFLVGRSKADLSRVGHRMNISQSVGAMTLQALPNGLWTYEVPAGTSFDENNAAAYAAMAKNPTSPNGPRLSAVAMTLAQNAPRIQESQEDTAKVDFSYALNTDRLPFLNNIKWGGNRRSSKVDIWGNGGYTVKPASGGQAAITVPTINLRPTIQGCENLPTTTAANACAYGTTMRTGINALDSNTLVTPAKLQELIAASLNQRTASFFNGAKDRPAGLIDGWTDLDVRKFIAMAGIPNMNLDCARNCLGSDGKLYAQPTTNNRERITAGYLMTEFDLTTLPYTQKTLPWNMELNGNFGWRYVRTEAEGTGLFTYTTSFLSQPGSDPSNPVNYTTATLSQNTSIKGSTTDIMPMLNLALWTLPNELVLRYARTKNIARPNINQMVPGGTCTFDPLARLGSADPDSVDLTCSGTMGNPNLKPYTNINQNFAAEWYPNADTMLSLAHFRQKGRIGAPLAMSFSDLKLFEGSDAVDPVSGRPLSELEFRGAMFVNGPAVNRKGLEVALKTAFTALPWYLRHTGFDANYTKVRSSNVSTSLRDLNTGVYLPPVNEPRYSYNTSLWYDDGALQMRVALQVVSAKYDQIAENSAGPVNNYPALGTGARWVVGQGYLPGYANFTDTTRFIDAKIGYKFKNGVELFAEARNLGRHSQTRSQPHAPAMASGAPALLDMRYAGARYTVGLNFRTN